MDELRVMRELLAVIANIGVAVLLPFILWLLADLRRDVRSLREAVHKGELDREKIRGELAELRQAVEGFS